MELRQPYPQAVWVEINTHTHANWVFTDPASTSSTVEFAADLVGGGMVTDTRGTAFRGRRRTTADAAFAAAFTEPLPLRARKRPLPDAAPTGPNAVHTCWPSAWSARPWSSPRDSSGSVGRAGGPATAERDQHTMAGHDRHAT